MSANFSRVIRLTDLPTRISESDVISCFTADDNLVRVSLVKVSEDSVDCAGYGYLYFSDVSDAVSAFDKYQNAPIRGFGKRFRLTYVPEFRETPIDEFQVYVGNIPLSTTDQELYEVFSRESPHVTNLRIIRKVGDVSRGFGFVQYEKSEYAFKSVVRMQKASIQGQSLIVRETYQRSRVEIERGIDCVKNCSIFVGNLNLSMGDVELAKSFEKFGTVIASKVVPNRGFGFLSFSDHIAALAALSEMQNTEIHNQRVHLAWGREDQQVEKSSDQALEPNDANEEFHAAMLPKQIPCKPREEEPQDVAKLLQNTLKRLRPETEEKTMEEVNREYIMKRLNELTS